ncbi:MAG: type IV toxin-antitoxin system AbiEi family antitoxin [Halobacteriota archaeon]|jgi:hypothetical protein
MGNTTTERNTIERVLEAIGRETGLTARVLQWQPQLNWHTPARPDALIEIDVRPHAEQFAAEVKNLDRFEILHQLRAFWPRQAKPALLVVAPYITAKVAEQCREMDLYFADTAGNAYIRAPGLHLYVTGKRKPDDLKTAEEGKITNPAGLRVVFALLCKPELLNATYRDIAAAARVALGTIGPVMKELETRRHITPAPEGGRAQGRKFLEPQRLVQEWVAVYPTVLRPKLNIRRFRAQQAGWTKGLDLQPYHAFWGGEVAANRLFHHLEPQTATIYARDTPKQLITEYKMRADVNGDVEILDAFWNPNHVPTIRDLVPPILAYADLTTTTDGRNLEAAKMIYDEFIEPALRNQA